MPAQPVAAHSSGVDSVHPATQARQQSIAMHAGDRVPHDERMGTAGGAPQPANIVNLIDSSDDEALLASMPLPAAAVMQGRGSVPSDSHRHEDGDDWALVQDAGMPVDDGMVWAPEEDAMDASFLSDDEAAGTRTAQPVHINTSRSSQFGLENCNRAGNEGSARTVHSIKELVTDFASGAGSGKYLVRTTPSLKQCCYWYLQPP